MSTDIQIVTDADPKQVSNYLSQMKMIEDAAVHGIKAHILRSAAIYNINTLELYRAVGCKSFKEYCEKMGLQRSHGYYLLDSGKKIASIMEDSPMEFTGEIKRAHIDLLIDAGLKVKELRQADIKLLSDGTVVVENGEVVNDNNDDDETMSQLKAMVNDKAQEKLNSQRKASKKKPSVAESYRITMEDLLTALTAGGRKVAEIWNYLKGVKDGDRDRVLYHLRFIQWHATRTPRKAKEADFPFVEYDAALEGVADDTYTATTRPDILFALGLVDA